MNASDIGRRDSLALPWKRKAGTLADDEKFTKRLPFVKRFSAAARGHIVAILGELVGTFLFLFFAYAATLNANTTNDQIVSKNLYISLGFGFSLAVNAWTFFRVSGGLFNPAVTWGMCLVGGITWTRGLLLFVAQIAGAMVAAGMARALFPADLNVQTMLADGTTLTQGFFIEMFLTLQLVLTIFLLAAEKHRATFIAPVGIGLALFLAELAGVRYTGGSLNPARSFAPAAVNANFQTYHWIYWVAPILGSTVAALIYKLIKMLEYETANPEADDTGEQRVVIADDGTVLEKRSPSHDDASRTFSPGRARASSDRYRGSTPVSPQLQQSDSAPRQDFRVASDLENGIGFPPSTSAGRT